MPVFLHSHTLNAMTNQTQITCTHCQYNLVGIDLAGVCPECGYHILEKCFWCDYDLTSTAPNDNCPECGVPAINSIGAGVLATTPDAILQSIYTGFKLASTLIPVSVIWLMVMPLIIGAVLAMLYGETVNLLLTLLFLVSKLLILAMIFGWSKIASPITGLPESINGSSPRKLLNATLIIFATIIAISIPISFIPTNPDPAAPSELINHIHTGIFFAGLLSLIVLYFAQLWYMQWFTKLTKNPMMHKRAKYMVWFAPLIVSIGFMFFLFAGGPRAYLILALFIVLALYWNLLDRTCKDLKTIRQHNQAIA